MQKTIVRCVLLCAVSAGMVFLAAADGDGLLNAVPADAQIVLSLRSMAELRQSISQNAWGQFARDPEVKAFIQYWAEKVDISAEEETEWKELSPANLYETVSGGIAAFVILREKEAYGIGILIAPGEERDAFDEYFGRIQQKLLDNEDFVDSLETYEGQEILVFERTDEESESSEAGLFLCDMPEAVFLYGDSSAEQGLARAQGLVDRIMGSSSEESILDVPLFTDTRKKTGGTAQLEGFVDAGRLISLIPIADEAEPEVGALLQALGLSDIKAAYARAELGKDERVDGSLFIGIEGDGAIRGLLDCFRGPAPRELLKYAPQDAVTAGAFHADINALYARVMDLVKTVDEGAYEWFRQTYDQAVKQRFGIDPETEILALLDGRMGTFSVQVSEEEAEVATGTPGGTGLGTLYAVGLKDAGAFQTNFEKTLKVFGLYVSLKTEEFQGQKLYSIALPGTAARLSWTFSSDLMALSASPSALRAFVRRLVSGDQPTILGREAFASFLVMGSKSASVSVAQTAESLKTALAVAEQLFANPAFTLNFEGGAGWTEPPPWPSKDTVDKYFSGVMGSFADVDDEGLHYRIAGR